MRVLETAIAAVMAAAGTASARDIGVVTTPGVPVCIDSVSNIVPLFQAKAMASDMFAAAGVAISWHHFTACPAGGIRIGISEHSRDSDHPNSFAYALPYEGIHIVLFWDRIVAAAEPHALRFLLAHVLVHEITHVLQGIPRHSETGVMKAAFRTADIVEMQSHALPFTDEDVDLIQRGMKARQARLLLVDTSN